MMVVWYRLSFLLCSASPQADMLHS